MNLLNLLPLLLFNTYDESCGGSSTAADIVVANKGINEPGATGPLRHVFFTDADYEIASYNAVKQISTFDTATENNELTYIGFGTAENGGEDEERFTNTVLKIDIPVSKGTQTITFTESNCVCTHAELLKLNGRSGRFIFVTELGFARGVTNDQKAFQGFAGQITFGKRDFATDDNQFDPTVFTINFTDFDADAKRMANVKVDWEPTFVKQREGLHGVASNSSWAAGTLSFDIDLTSDCDDDPVTGWALADFQAEDSNGSALTIVAVTENGGGNYTFDVTVAASTDVFITTAGANKIVNKAGDLYYLNTVTAAGAAA